MIVNSIIITLTVLAVYLCALFCLNFYYRKTSSQMDYSTGNRKMGAWTMALSSGASDNSGWLFLGLPGVAYLFGFSQVWIIIGLVVGCYLNWFIVAPYLRGYVDKNPSVVTIPELLENEFSDYGKIIRCIAALLIIFFSIVYISANIVALSILLEKFGFFNYHSSIIFTAVFASIYVSIGGFAGICSGDVLQALFMIFSSIVVSFVCFFHIDVTDLAVHSYQTFTNSSFIEIISLASWGLGYFGQPHILSRFMAIENVKLVDKSRKIALTWSVCCWFFVMLAGISGSLYFKLPLEDSETVFISLAQSLLNPWIVGIVFVSICAAIISTITAQIMVNTDIIIRDLFSIFTTKKDFPVFFNHIIVLSVVFLSSILSWFYTDTVMSLLSYAWSGLGASFGPTILLCSLGFKITDVASLSGITSGAFTIVAWRYLEMHNYMYEMFPAFIISCLVLLIMSNFRRVNVNK